MPRYRITCWKCSHTAEGDCEDAPLSRRLKCSACGTGWPSVDEMDRKLARWRDAFKSK